MKTYVVGHKNPDTDSVVAAIAYSSIEEGYIPARAGELNKETQFVLNQFGLKAPELLPTGEKKVVLVDTNGNPEEMAEGLSPEEVFEVIDHHKLGGLKTAIPIEVYIKPYGSTATLIKMIADGHQKKLDGKISGILLAGIISDTLKFTSPTTTEKDKEVASELAETAEVDIEDLAEKMFAAKSDISDVPTQELLGKDYKVFEMSGKKIGIGVWETVLPQTILERRSEILEELAKKKVSDDLDFIYFASVDILGSSSNLFVTSDQEKEVAEAVWGGEAVNGILHLAGVVSRKKQIVPPLENYFSNKA